ncbi:molybdate ABC transporter permease subunit [Acetonema longum]|uniref:Molybdenum transport system permease n=1 Tax=Acetonema longum DSM 6540 TaxID=1009370 RepID=F7NG89_9FIRM|nr:molybdate ABC transporter permease subunit [Acetonema longum]EGO65007.1 ABC-type molybdate transport system, permease component [Acetonema longum DSM 6540]
MLDWQPVVLSIKVALMSLVAVAILGVGAAFVMRRREFPGKAAVEAVFTLPLVLPPVVTGFLLLLLLGRYGPVGRLLSEVFQVQLIFTPYAAMISGTVVAFPLMYQSAKAALQSVDPHLEDAARTLGAGEGRVFFSVTLPLAWPGLLAGLVLSFSRALGEFGATIMVAGNIPGKTQTLPLAIYFAAESNDLTLAGLYVIIISLMTFALIFWLNLWSKTRDKRRIIPFGEVG